jgi:2-phosphoglycolate phosphatase
MGDDTVNIKTVIFDLDGTLIDSRGDIISSVNKTLTNFNMPTLPHDIIAGYIGEGVELLIKRSIGEENAHRLEEAMKFYLDTYNEECVKSTPLFTGVQKVLEELKKNNINIALATNKSNMFNEKILKHLEIYGYFQVIMGAESVTNRKPAPDVVHEILDKVEGSLETTLIVGDSKFDMMCGKNAGIYTCGVTYGIDSIESLIEHEADFMIHNIEKLLRVVL